MKKRWLKLPKFADYNKPASIKLMKLKHKKQTTPQHLIIKLPKNSDKEKILKVEEEEDVILHIDEIKMTKIFSQKIMQMGVPVMAQQKRIQLGTMRVWVRSLASLSGLRIWCCHEL